MTLDMMIGSAVFLGHEADDDGEMLCLFIVWTSTPGQCVNTIKINVLSSLSLSVSLLVCTINSTYVAFLPGARTNKHTNTQDELLH